MSDALPIKPPKEAIDFFRKKGYKTSFSWQELWHEEHAYSFTVAKAMRADILQDIRTAMDEAIASGQTFKQFRENLEPTLADKGWWGRKVVLDPQTGEKKLVQLGSPRRLKTIYHTNIRSAYAAGSWQRIERTKRTRPYLRYVAVQDERTREQHKRWHNIILPVDHPFWSKHYPPNGWGCRCVIQQLSKRDLDRRGLKITAETKIPRDTKNFTNKTTGEITKVPVGISPGFDFNVGKARLKALVPPPVNRPLDIPYHGAPPKVEMPPPRKLAKNALYVDGLQERQYLNKFMREFDKDAKDTVFIDKIGEPTMISADLFKTSSGNLKIMRDMRHQYLGLLAKTIKDPDEIWHVWEEYPKGRMTLRKKYLARFEVDGEPVNGFVLFDTSENGWSGVTTFKPDKIEYLLKQRAGALVYRRENR
ncbi:MAG: hypothetical protein CBB87_08095 [Micavibrio sp. TMED27]|nr:hypothetical protein [Micavibrio sp.]OUT90631.1 MAG: hypothetical protein CBB87_08095 [Micavibrio sp. TMED27]|tara:strand:- start:510 stop:1769 length:1260 start_codon:yes stop_codon:yes gene_type:complete